MATWIEKSRSPEYSPAKLSQMLAGLESVIGIAELDAALAGETIIAGGYLNTQLIKANSILAKHIRAGEITADKLGVSSLSAISANIGDVTSGTITGATVRTSAGSDRIQLTDSILETYLNNVKRVQVDYDSLDFYNGNGSFSGALQGVYEDDINQIRINSPDTISLIAAVNQTDFYETRASMTIERYADTSSIAAYSQDELGTNSSMAYLTPTTFEVMATDTNIIGDFTVSYGTKAAVVETENYGSRKLYALETPDNRFVTYIEKELDIGEHYIEIEPMFRQTISDYLVFPHIQNMASVSIIERQENGFLVLVEGKPADVVFEINGKRIGYESIYMEEVILGKNTVKETLINEKRKANRRADKELVPAIG